MNISRIILPAIAVLFAGCTPLKLVMKVDPALKENAIAYELSYPDSLADKISGNRLNMSFGPYRVTDADLSWTGMNTEAEDPAPIVSFKEVKTSGNTTTTTEISGGPTSLFGYTRPAAEGEPSINKTSRSITYQFKVAQQTTWNAYCTHKAEERVIQYKNTNSVELLSSNYTCQYKKAGKSAGASNEEWTLYANHEGNITMTQKGKPKGLTAHSTAGDYVMPDGKPARSTTRTAGYTWSQIKDGNKKIVAAISVREETPRVWLDKGNTEIMNHILSMANTGLLIYGWEIQP